MDMDEELAADATDREVEASWLEVAVETELLEPPELEFAPVLTVALLSAELVEKIAEAVAEDEGNDMPRPASFPIATPFKSVSQYVCVGSEIRVRHFWVIIPADLFRQLEKM
jgi:hypothetical protein